jgi:hypothetical protein
MDDQHSIERKLHARELARAHREAANRRRGSLRRRLATGALALFLAAWAAIFATAGGGASSPSGASTGADASTSANDSQPESDQTLHNSTVSGDTGSSPQSNSGSSYGYGYSSGSYGGGYSTAAPPAPVTSSQS